MRLALSKLYRKIIGVVRRITLAVYERTETNWSFPTVILSILERKKEVVCLPLTKHNDEINCTHSALLPEEEVGVSSPSTDNQLSKKIHLKLPSISLRKYQNAVVKPGCSTLVLNDRIVYESYRFDEASDGVYTDGQLIAVSDGLSWGISSRNYTTEIDAGVILFGRGEHNYFHWLMEYIPRLLVLGEAKLRSIPLIISEVTIQNENLKRALDLALGKYDFEIIIVPQNKTFLIKEAYYIDPPSHVLYIPKSMERTKIQHGYFRPNAVEQVRQLVKDTSPKQKDSSDKIFLARKQGGRREYNQSAIMDWFVSNGFTPIYTEDLSVEEQAHVFGSAAEIVGPTGAAWTNLVFCTRGVKALCWMDRLIQDFSVFSTLAEIVGVQMKYLLYTSEDSNNFHSNYTLELEEVEACYQNLTSTN